MSKNNDIVKMKIRIIDAGYKAVEHLIKVAEENVVHGGTDGNGEAIELAADRLKNAAAAKKIAIFDAFEILNRIEAERESINEMSKGDPISNSKKGFAERRSTK